MSGLQQFKVLFGSDFLKSVYILSHTTLSKKYRYSFLGWMWTLLLPTVQILIYAFVFSVLLKVPQKAHAIYIMTGLLPWIFMSSAIITSCNSILSQADVVKRCVIPRSIFPITEVTVAFYNFLVSFLSLLAISMVFYGNISWTMFLLPVAILPLMVFTISLSVGAAFITPYFRDLIEFVNVFFMMGFYLTPILYQIDMIPDPYREYFALNPLYMLFKPIFDVVSFHQLPTLMTWVQSCSVAIIATVISYIAYRFTRDRVIYYL